MRFPFRNRGSAILKHIELLASFYHLEQSAGEDHAKELEENGVVIIIIIIIIIIISFTVPCYDKSI